MDQVLTLKWTTSRARDTYGYNVVTLTDAQTGHRYRADGGGYDMVGTVFGEWLQGTYQLGLVKIADRAHRQYAKDSAGGYVTRDTNDAPDSLYGMSATTVPTDEAGHVTAYVSVDGGCGLQSMERIAEAIGLKVRHVLDRRGNVTMFIVGAS